MTDFEVNKTNFIFLADLCSCRWIRLTIRLRSSSFNTGISKDPEEYTSTFNDFRFLHLIQLDRKAFLALQHRVDFLQTELKQIFACMH